MGLITVWFVFKLDKTYDEVAIALLLIFSIIVYPPSQVFYAILLIIPLLWLWKNRKALFSKNVGILILGFTVIYEFLFFRHGDLTLVANLFIWLILLWVSFKFTWHSEFSLKTL
jgi:hypothetical protein